MTPTARAYAAGRAARDAGQEATSNPHDDWELGVAWATGWHDSDVHDKDYDSAILLVQAALVGLIPLKDNEGGYPRGTGYA